MRRKRSALGVVPCILTTSFCPMSRASDGATAVDGIAVGAGTTVGLGLAVGAGAMVGAVEAVGAGAGVMAGSVGGPEVAGAGLAAPTSMLQPTTTIEINRAMASLRTPYRCRPRLDSHQEPRVTRLRGRSPG
jgi:hypothetical protein